MSVKIQGLNKMLSQIDSKLGAAKMQQIEDRALNAGAKVFIKELTSQFQSFRDTGASIEEMTVTEPYTLDGKRTVTVKWVGPKKRYTIVHLNEFGTVHNPSPKGKGAIARSLQNSRAEYRRVMKKEIEGALR